MKMYDDEDFERLSRAAEEEDPGEDASVKLAIRGIDPEGLIPVGMIFMEVTRVRDRDPAEAMIASLGVGALAGWQVAAEQVKEATGFDLLQYVRDQAAEDNKQHEEALRAEPS